MFPRVLQCAGLSFVLLAILVLGACQKKTAAIAPPKTPPPPAQPVAQPANAAASVQPSQPSPSSESKGLAQNSAAISDSELFRQNVKDIYFNYDRYDVRPADAATLELDAKFLATHPGYKIVIAGHCDERGSEEYNLALGSNRANGVRDQLNRLGIAADRVTTISYGKEKPFCTEQNEQCWQENRRAHFSLDR